MTERHQTQLERSMGQKTGTWSQNMLNSLVLIRSSFIGMFEISLNKNVEIRSKMSRYGPN